MTATIGLTDTPLDVLTHARRLLARPHGWTTGTWAKPICETMQVCEDPYKTSDGMAFCMVGAMEFCKRHFASAITIDIAHDRVSGLILDLDPTGEGSLEEFNDGQASVGPILAVLDAAILSYQ